MKRPEVTNFEFFRRPFPPSISRGAFKTLPNIYDDAFLTGCYISLGFFLESKTAVCRCS